LFVGFWFLVVGYVDFWSFQILYSSNVLYYGDETFSYKRIPKVIL